MKKKSHFVRNLTVSDDEGDIRPISEFLEEGTIMKDFNHKNVLSLMGVVIQDNKPYVLLPIMDKGDLKKYVSDPNNVSHRMTFFLDCVDHFVIIDVKCKFM